MAPTGPFQPSERDSGPPSAGLTLNLSSNNPFRNRAASPASLIPGLASPPSPFDDPPSRPTSRNPFIDQPPPPLRSPGVMSNNSDSKSLSAEDIFDSLTLDDTKPASRPPTQRPMDSKPAPRQGENNPPPYSSVNHRPTRSQEEAMRARKIQAGSARPGPSTSPQRKMQRRPRRNSESSVMGVDANGLTEEERKIIAKHRERDRLRRELRDREGRDSKDGARDGKEPRDGKEGREGREGRDGKERKKSSRPNRPSRRMDIIDQLDATSIYGTGLFHHDGPFDALNPHRNRNTSRRAPMQAFPKDSLNNSIGGSGPLNKAPDHAQFMGRGETEAFRDFAASGKNKNGPSGEPIFNPVSRDDIVHGDESYGLGTSTFLEGTPAARTAIARREAEQAQDAQDGGLQRKKSLAQRIRHINKGPRGDFGPSGRLTNPDGAYTRRSPESVPTGGSGGENNPFFSEFSKGEDSLSVRPRDGALSPTSPPPPVPRRGSNGGPLERRATTDATMSTEDLPAKPSGFLGRMKSLKGGRKPRNASNTDAEGNQYPIPGTAV